jgi:hypothetical protein
LAEIREGKMPLWRRWIDGRIALKWVWKKWGVTIWIGLIGLRTGVHWRTDANTVMNPRLLKKARNFLTSRWLSILLHGILFSLTE